MKEDERNSNSRIERMTVRNLVLIILTMIAAYPALADSVAYTATLAEPLAAKKEVIIGANIFRCEGSACVLVSRPSDAQTLSTCHTLERKVGTLTNYVAEGKAFDADKLAKCNAH